MLILTLNDRKEFGIKKDVSENYWKAANNSNQNVFAGSLEAAYLLNWGAREIWGKGGGETLALLW